MKERIITAAIFLVIIASSFYFGFHRLSNFSGVDEPYWSYDRVPNFWQAIEKQQWKKTNISDKPGVPLAIVSGTGLLFLEQSPKDYKYLRYISKTPQQLADIHNAYFWLRLPVFLFTLAILPLMYFLIKKLLGKNTARFAILFIGLSPILLGISLIINSDAMLWILGALSTLSLFVYFKNAERKYLLLSGFFLGLSVITKYVANILFVYFFFLFLLEYIFFAHQKVPIAKYLKRALVDYLLLVVVAMATAFVFFPATWVDLSKLWKATIGNEVFSAVWPIFVGLIVIEAVDLLLLKARFSNAIFGFISKYRLALAKIFAGVFLLFSFFVFLHVFFHLKVFNLQAIIASPKGIGEGSMVTKFVGALSADIYSLLFSISPLVLLFVLYALLNIFRRKEMDRQAITVAYILIFVFLYYLGSTVNDVITTVRYQIMVYPLMLVLAAIGVTWLFELKPVKKNVSLPIVFLGTVTILIASLAYVNPNFLAYASEILPNNYIVNLKGMGEGSVEAANYLNNLPDAQNIAIWSDKGAVCESFVGKCFIDFKLSNFRNNAISYFVISTDRRSRSLKMSRNIQEKINFPKLYSGKDFIYNVTISNNPNDFVRVFKADEFINESKLNENEGSN